MCFTLFSDVTFFLLPGSEHGVGREFFICEDAAFVKPVCPRLVFGYAVPGHLVKYSVHTDSQGSGVLLRFYRVPTKMGRKSLCLRQVFNFCGLDNALSTLLSCCSQHFFPVRVLASFIYLHPVVTLSDNDSKQIAAATSFRMSALFNTKNFFSEGQKNFSELVE